MLRAAGRYDEAEPYANQAYRLEGAENPKGPNAILCAVTLAELWRALGRDAELKRLLIDIGPANPQSILPSNFRTRYQGLLAYVQTQSAHYSARGLLPVP